MPEELEIEPELFEKLKKITRCSCTHLCAYLRIAKRAYELGVEDAKS